MSAESRQKSFLYAVFHYSSVVIIIPAHEKLRFIENTILKKNNNLG